MTSFASHLDRRLYPQFEKNWDDKLFREYILSALRPEHHLLDVGAGAGFVSEMNFRGLAARVCGIDPDPRVAENPYLDDAKIGLGERIDYPDETFDMVIADNVLEHLDNPVSTFVEINRVLKPEGRFLFKTPNRFHYMPMISTITPTSFHKFFNRKRGRPSEDTFPTHYRANSRKQISEIARKTGFDTTDLRLVEGRPEYLRFSPPTYIVGWCYERLVNSSEVFAGMRILLVGDLKKAASVN